MIYSVKVESKGKLRDSNLYLMIDGEQQFPLFCSDFAIRIDGSNTITAEMTIVLPSNMDKNHYNLLTEIKKRVGVYGIWMEKNREYLTISLPVSDASIAIEKKS